MNGIMSNIEDRENYATGSARERLERVASEFPDQGISPLNQFLIQGGLNLMSQPSTGSTLGDIATAAKGPTAQLFKDLSARGQLRKKLALEGEALDIKRDMSLAELEKKAELKVGKEFRTDQVRPAFENVVTKRAEAFMQSKNPAVKQNPTLTAQNYIRFTREASPEIQSKFKGFKPYTRNNKGNIVEVPYEGKPGEIIYDPISQEFLVFDNTGETFFLNPLTFDIEEK